jgi:hypothetical protein
MVNTLSTAGSQPIQATLNLIASFLTIQTSWFSRRTG